MSIVTVYHGATEVVNQPLCNKGRKNLDFGPGFYVTDIYAQAESWAKRQGDNRKLPPVINSYNLDREAILSNHKCLVFTAYDVDWLNFIADSREGKEPWRGYDYIEGGVADDRVIDTVNLYLLGLMTADVALTRLAYYKPNNQMCILTQDVVDEYLHFTKAENIK